MKRRGRESRKIHGKNHNREGQDAFTQLWEESETLHQTPKELMLEKLGTKKI